MCGIAGFVGARDSALLRSMCDSLYHRGPDDEGYYEDEQVSLSMRRLAIIDIASGHQPVGNETNDIWVVFNGEIYNYESLRDELAARGHRFRTHSDTETIVHAYEEFGLDFASHLHGMFAVALWDSVRKRLVLARDRIGEKPLYYGSHGGRFYFGSEMKAVLLTLPGRSVDAQAVCDYFCAGYVTAPRTFYPEIRKLGAGNLAVFENGGLTVRSYWQLHPEHTSDLSFHDAEDLLDAKLQEAIRLCLKSDVEVAAFLSGGIDSSLIVALMAKQAVDIQTFSVGYSGAAAGFNELNYAKIVADHVGTRHHELILGPESNIQLLPKMIYHYDEPHGEPTSMLVYLLCEFVQKRVKVALGGTGGDELFYGYPRHAGLRYLQYYRVLPTMLRKQVIERIAASLPESTRGRHFTKRVKRFLSGAALTPAEAYLSWVKLLHPELQRQLISDAVRSDAENPAGDQFLKDTLLGNTAGNLLDRVAAIDIKGYLPEYQLAYMDRMSMATSLEVRAPLCDYSLAEFAVSLPSNYRLKRTRSKHILKSVAKRYLPENIVERRKVGFDSPIGQWFKDELRPFMQSFLDPRQVERTGLLNSGTVTTMLNDHCRGSRNYSLQLWSVVALEAWHRMYIEDNVTNPGNIRLNDIRGAEIGVRGG